MKLRCLITLLVVLQAIEHCGATYCYLCTDCNNEEGQIIDCSTYYDSSSCYLIVDHGLGQVIKSCGSPELDCFNIPQGCTNSDDYTLCRCETDLCNSNNLPSTYGLSTASIPPPVVHDTTSQTDLLTSQLSNVRPTSEGTVDGRWFCYLCNDCGNEIGELFDCSVVSSTRSCLLTRDLGGKVYKHCGTSDSTNRANGCETTDDGTICTCSENACNTIPRFGDSWSIDASVQCHICVDCGQRIGLLQNCLSTTSCSMIIHDGVVTKSCGSSDLNDIIPDEQGCKSSTKGITCKCSTDGCNAYPGIMSDWSQRGQQQLAANRSTTLGFSYILFWFILPSVVQPLNLIR